MKISGIYKIINKVNGKYYVGSSCDIKDREYKHFQMLKNKSHHNIHLQRSYNKHGIKAFKLKIIRLVEDSSQLLKIEQEYLNVAYAEKSKCFNVKFTASGNQKLDKVSDETKEKRRNAMNEYYKTHSGPNLGRKWSKETKLKLSKARIGKAPWNKGIKGKQAGHNHPRFDPTIYTFINKGLNISFNGTGYDFIIKFNLPKSNLSKFKQGKIPNFYGWENITNNPTCPNSPPPETSESHQGSNSDT